MTVRLHNTLTGTKDVFEPLDGSHVRMYTCGPTVWNFAHVGNLRAFVFYDLLRRHLQVAGFRVTHVMNITDIDDRILDQATHAGTTIAAYTVKITCRWRTTTRRASRRVPSPALSSMTLVLRRG